MTEDGKAVIDRKTLIPDTFDDGKGQNFDHWTDDLQWYLDACHEGLREVLVEVDKMPMDKECDATTVMQLGDLVKGINVIGWARQLYNTLRKLTKGEPRSIINNVQDHDGWTAYKTLRAHYALTLIQNKGTIVAVLGKFNTKKAKKPEDMKKLMVELAKVARRYE